jgi:hypothetical protein
MNIFLFVDKMKRIRIRNYELWVQFREAISLRVSRLQIRLLYRRYAEVIIRTGTINWVV